MIELFLSVINEIRSVADITQIHMYEGGYDYIDFDFGGEKYSLSIRKRDEQ